MCDQLAVVLVQHGEQPARVDRDDDEEQLDAHQQVHRLQHRDQHRVQDLGVGRVVQPRDADDLVAGLRGPLGQLAVPVSLDVAAVLLGGALGCGDLIGRLGAHALQLVDRGLLGVGGVFGARSWAWASAVSVSVSAMLAGVALGGGLQALGLGDLDGGPALDLVDLVGGSLRVGDRAPSVSASAGSVTPWATSGGSAPRSRTSRPGRASAGCPSPPTPRP